MKSEALQQYERDSWASWINFPVRKRSDKPFKSGERVGTPSEMTFHPITNRDAFVMKDDGSIVECRMVTKSI